MATLEKIRNHGALLLIVVGVAMLAFILGDFFSSGSTFANRSRENIGSIEGNDIHYTEYEAAREQLTEVMKIETGRNDMNDEMQSYINNQTWQTILAKYTLETQAEKIGMTVTTNELSELCIGEHPHQIIQQRRAFYDQSGQFNRLGLIQFLNSIDADPEDAEQAASIEQARSYWKYWENAVRLNYLQEKYINLLSELIGANTVDAKYAFNSRLTTANVLYAEQPYYSIPDSTIKISNGDIRKLYNQRKEQYKQEPNRAINYVIFDIVPSSYDYEEVEQWINRLHDEFINAPISELAAIVNSNSDIVYDGKNYSESTIPARYKDFAFSKGAKAGNVTEISFSDDTYSIARLIETGYALSDSVKLRYTVLANANQLDSLKQEWAKGAYGDASELGWLEETDMPKEMADQAFSLANHSIFSLPYGTGLQVAQIMEKSPATPKVKMAILERKVTASSKTYAALYNDAKQFVINNNTEEKFFAAAEEKGMTVHPVFNIDKNANKVDDLKQSRTIVRWAFGAKDGAVSDIFDCGDKYVAAVLTEVHDGEYRTFDEVSADLRREVLRDKKAEQIISSLQGINTLEEAAGKMNSEVLTADNVTFNAYRFGNAGVEPAAIGTALALQEGETSAPVKGNNGVFVLRSVSKNTTEGTFDAAAEIQQLNARYSYSLPYQLVNLIEEKADITDNRSNFY